MAQYTVLIIGILLALLGSLILKFNERDSKLLHDIKIVSKNENIDQLLEKYQDLIGTDFPGYKNHIYRVLSYSLHILEGDETYLPIIGTALVYHDIGLWTDQTLAYLEPSSARATEIYKSSLSAEELQLLHDIIYWHHKITPFSGAHADVVNAVRRGDWIDATQGLVHQGMPRANIDKVYAAIPVSGFYDTLQQFGPRLYGNDVVLIVREMTSILKW